MGQASSLSDERASASIVPIPFLGALPGCVWLYPGGKNAYQGWMRPYQWLLFDADDTLFDFERAEGLALEQTFQRLGLVYSPGHRVIYRRINQVLWHGVEKGEITPGLVKVRRFEQLLEAIGSDFSPETFSSSYLERLADCGELLPEAASVLQALNGKYRMAILTNGLQAVQRPRLAKSQIHHHFAEVIISEEIGFSKPSREFFDIALARLGSPPRREVLMIGDSWGSDMQGALQSGIDACWYNPGRKPCPARAELKREIASLSELVAWLG